MQGWVSWCRKRGFFFLGYVTWSWILFRILYLIAFKNALIPREKFNKVIEKLFFFRSYWFHDRITWLLPVCELHNRDETLPFHHIVKVPYWIRILSLLVALHYCEVIYEHVQATILNLCFVTLHVIGFFSLSQPWRRLCVKIGFRLVIRLDCYNFGRFTVFHVSLIRWICVQPTEMQINVLFDSKNVFFPSSSRVWCPVTTRSSLSLRWNLRLHRSTAVSSASTRWWTWVSRPLRRISVPQTMLEVQWLKVRSMKQSFKSTTTSFSILWLLFS